MELIARMSGGALSAALGVSLVAAVALVMERLLRHAAPPLRAALLRVALVRFAFPAIGLSLLPSFTTFAGGIAAPSATSPWWAALLAVWVAGALLALVRVARAALGVLRLVAASAPACPGATARLAALAEAIGIPAPPLRTSTRVAAPFVCGSIRPTIVLPAAWSARFVGGELDTVLLHELAHVKRGDLLWMELATIVGVAWWWHPLLHRVSARLSAAQEDACDDLAVSTNRGDAEDHGRALVRAAALAARTAAPAFSAGLGAERIERRLRRLADPRRRSGTRLTPAHLAAVLALAIVAALAPARGSGAPAPAFDRMTDSSRRDDAHERAHPLRHRHSHHRHP